MRVFYQVEWPLLGWVVDIVNRKFRSRARHNCITITLLMRGISLTNARSVILRWKQTPTFLVSFIVGAILGIAFFLSFYGAYVLNPTHINWLQNFLDLEQHYDGWVFYRQSPWTFPLGVAKRLAYPGGIPVTYTDSIPLLAIPFKAISGLLPATFQYFGLWGLLCFALQGGIGAMLVRRWSGNLLIIAGGATFFVLSPTLLSRMFVHTALASQWLLLAGIWFLLDLRPSASLRRQMIVWTALLLLALLITPYFLVMVGALFVMSLARTHMTWKSTAIKALTPSLIAIVVFWVIGGFAVQDTAEWGLGVYAFNLNSLYNPLGWSRFVANLPTVTPTFETLNYLGLGILLLLPVAIYLGLQQLESFSKIWRLARQATLRHYIIALAGLGLLVMAVSPEVQFGDSILLNVSLPAKLYEAWSIFRAGGRLFWPLNYLIVVGVLASLIRLNRRLSTGLLVCIFCLAVVIQVTDIRFSQAARTVHGAFVSYAHGLPDPSRRVSQWAPYTNGKRHLVIIGSIAAPAVAGYYEIDLENVALAYHLTINTGYFARTPQAAIDAYESTQRQAILSGKADMATTLFVTSNSEFIKEVAAKTHYSITHYERYYVIH